MITSALHSYRDLSSSPQRGLVGGSLAGLTERNRISCITRTKPELAIAPLGTHMQAARNHATHKGKYPLPDLSFLSYHRSQSTGITYQSTAVIAILNHRCLDFQLQAFITSIMKVSTYSAWFLAFVHSVCLVASAFPWGKGHHAPDFGHGCLSDSQAIAIVDRWRSLNVVFDEALSNSTLAEDFRLFSDSENAIAGGANIKVWYLRDFIPPTIRWLLNAKYLEKPGEATSTSRADWNAQQRAAAINPAVVDVTITMLNIVHDCTQIVFRWRFEGSYGYTGPTQLLCVQCRFPAKP